MLPFYHKYGRTLFDIVLIVFTIFLFLQLFEFLFRIAMPIFIGILIFVMINPLTSYLKRKGLKQTTATSLSMGAFILLILALIFTAGFAITSQIHQLSQSMPKYASFVETQTIKTVDFYQGKLETLSPDTLEKIKETASKTINASSEHITAFFLGLFGFFTSLSKLVINLVIGIVLAYFLSLESTTWHSFLRQKTPLTFKKAYTFMKNNVIKGIGAYIKAQLILITFTFLIVFIAFILLSVKNALLLALFAALLDLLPLIGMPVLFIPWGLYAYFTGNHILAFSLLGVWVFIFLFRQIFEPKIAGDSLGVSAFTMLASMILSLTLFGISGLILTPVLIISIKALYEEGHLKKWIHLPEDEFEQSEKR